MNHFPAHLPLLILATAAALSNAQSFPIVPLTDPVYPTNDPAFKGFIWESPRDGTLQRLGDLNKDGYEDLLVVFIGGMLRETIVNKGFWIFPGNQQGLFDQPQPLNIQIPLNNQAYDDIYEITIDDHNMDGNNDIIIGELANGAVPFINTDGVFVEGTNIQSNLESSRILYIDTDLDGDNDLVRISIEIYPHDLEISINDGHGNYSLTDTLQSNLQNSEYYQQSSFAFSDFELDGDLDILISNGATQVLIENTPQGYLAAVPWEINASNIVTGGYINTLADVNADGLADLVVPVDDGLGFFLAPFTNGETREIPFFQLPDFENDRSRGFFSIEDERLRPLHSPGDLDGDGTDDLILRPFENVDTAWRITDPLNHNSRFGISNDLHIHGDGNFGWQDPEQDYDFNYQEVYFDINNDGALDRLIPTIIRDYVDLHLDDTTQDHQGVMLWATLANPFMPDTVINEQDTIETTSTFHLTHADLDYDGEPEIVLTGETSARTVRRNLDDLWAYDRYPGNTNFRGPYAGFRTVATQLDTDNRVELISLSTQNGAVIPSYFINIEIPDFGEFYLPDNYEYINPYYELLYNLDIDFDSDSSSFAIGDLDSDGDNDLVIRGDVSTIDGPNGESVLVWLNDGEANFTLGPISLVESYINNNAVHMIELLDHDHDGDLELISIEGPADSSPTIAIYENDGQGNFTPSIQIPIHAYAGFQLNQYWIEINDLDLDGYDDIQILMEGRSFKQSEVVVLYGSPTGISTDPVYLAGRGAAEVHCADLDGNGLPDLYTCNYQSTDTFKNSISIMFQTEPRVFLPAISIHDNDFAAVDALDMNRDGGIDLIAGGTGNQSELRVFYSVPEPCTADLNLDKILDFFDITLFIRMYTNQRPLADLNRDGIIDFFDFSTLLDTFRNGCP